jgi:hypothetical protein
MYDWQEPVWESLVESIEKRCWHTYVEKVRKVSYADAVRGTNTHPESTTVYDAVHWHVVKSRKSKERNVRLSVSHSLE